MKTRLMILAAAGIAAGVTQANAQLWMYAIDGRGDLFRNELGSPVVEPVAEFGLNATAGLARGPSESIFAIDATTGIYQIDPNSGTVTNEYSFDYLDQDDPLAGLTAGLAYDAQLNTLHAFRRTREGGDPYLFTADLNTETSNLVALGTGNEPWLTRTSLNSIITRSDGMLVGIAGDRDGLDHVMFEIDPGTGAVEYLANFSIGSDGSRPSGISTLGDQSYLSTQLLNPDGSLYGTAIHRLDLYTGATNYVSTVPDQDLFGLVVNPAPSSLAALMTLGLTASRRRRTADAG